MMRAPILDEIRIGTLDLTLRSTFRTHWKQLRHHQTLHVRLRSGETWGEGEAYTMEVLRGLASLRDQSLEGRSAWDLDAILDPIVDCAARSAVDMALHDLLGRCCAIPVWRLLGLPHACRTGCVSIGVDEPDAMIEAARAWIERGYPILKVKLTTDTNLDVLRRIRAIGGPSLRIWVDANQAFEPDTAVQVARELARIGVEIFEQPLPVGRLETYASIRSAIGIPIILDEEIRSPEDAARAARAGGVDGINLKLAKVGGIRAALSTIHVARAHGLRILLGCFFESSLGIAGASTLLAHADFVDLDSPLHLEADPYRGLEFDGARVAPPNAPGFGVSRQEFKSPAS